MMVGFAAATTFIVYNAFFRGIYNWRARELVNMRKVPFALKFGISAAVGIALSRDAHLKNIYEPDLYKIALKYRTYYDTDYQATIENVTGENIENTTNSGKVETA